MRSIFKKAGKWCLRWYSTQRAKRVIASYKEPLRVNGPSSFSRYTQLGANTNFNGMKVYGRGIVSIGDNFHSGRGCTIMTENHNHAGSALPYDNTYIIENVTIGDNVWLGDGVLILPGISIGEGAIVQARSVVVSDIPPLAIAGGHPCRQFSQRDAVNYNSLKNAEKFH